MIPTPEHIRKCHTVKDGEWALDLRPTDSGVNFIASNNQYSEWLWEVERRGFVFNFVFGDFVSRLEKAKHKYQGWVDKKNAIYIHSKQVIELIQ